MSHSTRNSHHENCPSHQVCEQGKYKAWWKRSPSLAAVIAIVCISTKMQWCSLDCSICVSYIACRLFRFSVLLADCLCIKMIMLAPNLQAVLREALPCKANEEGLHSLTCSQQRAEMSSSCPALPQVHAQLRSGALPEGPGSSGTQSDIKHSSAPRQEDRILRGGGSQLQQSDSASLQERRQEHTASGWFVVVLLTAWLSSAGAVCPVSVSYEVSLGQQQDAIGSNISSYASVPIFFGRVAVYSNNVSASEELDKIALCWERDSYGSILLACGYRLLAVPLSYASTSVIRLQATIDTWRLGWNFSDGETLKQAQDIFTTGIEPLTLGNSTVQLETFDANNTVKPFEWTAVSFLANKAAVANPTNPYGVSLY